MTNKSAPDQQHQTVTQKVLSGETWNEFCDGLKAAGQIVIDNSADDELERAEGLRYLARIASNTMGSIDPAPLQHPLVHYGNTRIGADNPDFKYGSVRVTGQAEYRIHGRANDAFNFNIGAFHGQLGTAEGLQCSGFLSQSDLALDSDGGFTIVASKDRPQARGVNWLELCDATNSFTIRQTILDPGVDKPADFSIEITSGNIDARPKALSAQKIETGLIRSTLMLHGIVRQFVGWTNDFKERPNKISEIKPELLGVAKGDPNCQYNYAYFDLAEDEALVVRLRPPKCDYWNIQLANHWMESFDSSNAVASINNASAILGQQGEVDVIISERDPGQKNWLATQFHRRGTLALRWVGATQKQADPETLVCKVCDIAAVISQG